MRRGEIWQRVQPAVPAGLCQAGEPSAPGQDGPIMVPPQDAHQSAEGPHQASDGLATPSSAAGPPIV